MHVPFDAELGIHPQDAAFLDKELWDLENTPARPTAAAAALPPARHLPLPGAEAGRRRARALPPGRTGSSGNQKLADFEYYDPLTTGDSTLSAVVQSIIAAEVGYHELARRYFRSALFVDLADLHHNTADGVHVASTGGVWSALVFGFGGFRDHEGRYTFDPRFPTGGTGSPSGSPSAPHGCASRSSPMRSGCAGNPETIPSS